MQRVAVLKGGFQAWKAADLPVFNIGSDAQCAWADSWAQHQGGIVCAANWQQAPQVVSADA